MMRYLLALPIVLVLLMAATNAYALQFSFDPSTGQSFKPAGFGFPAAIIAAVSLTGAFLIVHERRKANGIWFSKSEGLK